VKRFQVTVAPAALDDVEAILRRVEVESPQNAAMLAERFAVAFESLREYPERCAVVTESETWNRTVRCLMVFHVRVLFTVSEERVAVLRVLHGGRHTLPTPEPE
jgi:plasmid stabilization system protein ParE